MAWVLASKELNGIIYLARLPKASSGNVPGVPDGFPTNWFAVGPGLRPSVQNYGGTQYILTFDYLSHLFTRVIDIATWPPTTVNPVLVSGGPNPPNPFQYTIELAQDALILKTASTEASGLVESFYNPPQLQFPLLFLNPVTDTYSITIQLAVGWVPQVSPSVQPFYQLWYRAIGTTPWLLLQDWVPAGVSPTYAFNYLFSHVGSLRYQFSLIWGSQFNFTDQWNPANHEGGIVGFTYLTIDSNVLHPSFQAIINEMLTLDISSTEAYGIFGSRQLFLTQSVQDSFPISRSLIGAGDEAYGFFGERQLFVYTQASDQLTYPFMGGVTPGVNNFSAGSEAAPAYIGA